MGWDVRDASGRVIFRRTKDSTSVKSLACDTVNEHALERHAAAVRQLSNGTNGDDL